MKVSICKETYDIVIRQLKSFWQVEDIVEDEFLKTIALAIEMTEQSYNQSNRVYYLKNGFSILNTTVYTVFLYYLAKICSVQGEVELADKIILFE